MSKMTVAEFLYQSGLRINNSMNDEAVLSAVSQFGYTPEKLETGKILLDESVASCEKFDKEHGDVSKAFDDRNGEKEKVSKLYRQYFTVAQIVFKNDPSAQVALELSGRRAGSLSGWIKQIRSFYKNLLANEGWITAMQEFGVTVERLNTGIDGLNRVENYAEVIMREKGDAQNATVERDKKIDELAEWVSDYEKIAEIALLDDPQLLEKLGIIVKN